MLAARGSSSEIHVTLVITGVTWKIVKPSPLAPLPQERGTRK
jgi:hypothetical protein